jgi:hypothetical protein
MLHAESAGYYPGLSCRVWYPVIERRKTGVVLLLCAGKLQVGWDVHFELLPERRGVSRRTDNAPPWITSSTDR